MKEIKFRGLSLIGVWRYGNLAIVTNKTAGAEPGSYISNEAGMPFAFAVRPETVGQYIGLDDGRKKEIYHFDILRLTGTKELSLVVWHFNRWALRDPRGRLREFNKLDFEAGWFEIVGSNFENPELLKESK